MSSAPHTAQAARIVLITGGGTGIGRALAAHFAKEGEAVHITGRRQGPLEEAARETGAVPHVCDHADPAALERLLAALPERIDVLVNNAGGNTGFERPQGEGLAAFAEGFRSNLEANLLTAALTTEAVRDRLADGGAVIHMGSIAADRGNGSYGAAKAALHSWNVGLSRELGPRGITANVVSPGYIAETDFFHGHLTEERRDHLVAETAVRRPGVPEDIAAAVAYLASPGARHVTGQVLNVNGGAEATR